MKMTAAKAIVEVMAQEGVTKAFCVPGESYLSVMNELYEHPQIELIHGRHEGGVSFMAEGYAKASGKVGVCFATRGPGATNLSIGLHTANQDSTPLVAFIGQVEREFLGREGFQEIDLAAYFSHLVKWTVELDNASRVPELVHRAFHMARSGRPGPVLVSLPQDVLDEVAEMSFQDAVVYSAPRPDREAVLEAKKLLESAQRPVIIAGGGVTGTKSAPELVALSERLNVPVTVSFRRFDAFPNQHPHYAGHVGIGPAESLLKLIKEADVVLAIGTRFSQITSQDYTLLNPKSKLIHVDISQDELNKVYRPALGIVADSKRFMQDLMSELDADNTYPERTAYVQQAHQNYLATATPQRKNVEGFVSLDNMIIDLMEQLPSDAILTSDAGNFFGWMARYYSFREEGTFVGPTSGAMGYGLPAAIGAKVAKPERTVVSFSGDGGFMMTMQELETAVRHQIPVIAIVANNNRFGTIRMHQEKIFPDRVIATELSNPNFGEFMRNVGGHGEVVQKSEDFPAALQRAIASGKPAVIEVMIDPNQITATKTVDELRGAVVKN
ncbi:thiamine pyrophosphate-dependent enzyme [Ammoniphilus resinae]|uniref:Acetolactate synthase-1/2/3 large subunit n=1 Tax=Ammoniphilus resinae TaxID=861532 RepID=A0ABS4GUD7_9BACL|nr:thiamine pyrophosphate-dependent enzyme [Ammoniphilus resinae]MBP1933878.1 acetolactate synthase-1/2/3 large subunit [Ammoniphilus resinae]